MLQRLLNRFRTRPAPEPASEDAPGTTIPNPALPDDVHMALAKLQGDWAEMQLQWAEVLDKLQGWANRQSARDRKAASKALDRLAQDEASAEAISQVPTSPPDIEPTIADQKAELRRRVASMRGMR